MSIDDRAFPHPMDASMNGLHGTTRQRHERALGARCWHPTRCARAAHRGKPRERARGPPADDRGRTGGAGARADQRSAQRARTRCAPRRCAGAVAGRRGCHCAAMLRRALRTRSSATAPRRFVDREHQRERLRPRLRPLRDGTRERVAPIADSNEELLDLMRRVATRFSTNERRFDRASPFLSAQHPNGARFTRSAMSRRCRASLFAAIAIRS